MSFINYICRGSGGINQQFCRQNYPHDETRSIGTSNQYRGTLGTVTRIDDTQEEVTIDSAVKVSSVAREIREKAINFWNKAKSGSYITFTAVLLVGVLAGGAAVALGTVLPELWIIAASVGAVALATLGISIFLLSKAINAGHRLKAWKEDPVTKAQNDRVRIGNEGFYPAFSDSLKGKIVSEQELQGLWARDMDDYVERFENDEFLRDSTKVSMVREFIRKSPLSNAALNYTFDDVEPSIQTVNTKFESVKTSADAIRRESNALRNQINNKKRQAMHENDSHRDALLLPYRLMIKPKQVALEARISSLRMSLASQRNQLAQQSVRRRGVVTQPAVAHHGHVIPRNRVQHNVIPGTRMQRVPAQTVVVQQAVNPHLIAQLNSDIQMKEMELCNLEGELREVNRIYLAMTLPIKNMHARNEAKIEAWARAEIAKIQSDEDNLMKRLFNPIQDILREYATRNEQEPVIAENLNDDTDTINLETPEIETRYEPVQYDDSWRSVIDEFEWRRKQADLVEDQLIPSQMK